MADRALQRGWLTLSDVEHRLTEHPGRTGNTRLREVATTCGDGAAAHSERLLHRLLRQAGIDDWLPNHPVWFEGELVAVVDVAIRSARLAIEVDGRAFHTDVDRFQRDRQRQNALVALGWTVLRFTWADLIERPGYVVATIQGHLP
ncbi:endonuclease domain-containing protein [uncultured Jatrophihabitans sp.]|uniref:endonuclease domain-containing protein n=1 Tax=uncultured Jatrophihabitans sp. TaxID=1610747 RepID=UPI0035C9DC0B